MNINYTFLFIVVFFVFKNNKLKSHTVLSEKKISYSLLNSTDPEKFYTKQCGFCHNKEELMAPDMNKIKAFYKQKYPDKKAFVNAIVAFVQNPSKSSAIYQEGIKNFCDMPKMPFKKNDIKAVASYIYDKDNL